MCQKAFGAFYAPLVTGHELTWTRGEPAWFQSSNRVRRGFCGSCGTPLVYDWGGAPEVAIGALDDPRLAAPVMQLNLTDKLPFVDSISGLPTREGTDDGTAEFMRGIVSYQHPDHETDEWPLEHRSGDADGSSDT